MEFNLIAEEKNCPFTLTICDLNGKNSHFHKDLELVYVLSGIVTVKIHHKKHTLFEKNLFLINPYENHLLTSQGETSRVLFLKINLMHFQHYFSSNSIPSFIWEDSFCIPGVSIYNTVSECLRQMVILATNQNQDYLAGCFRNVMDILLCIYRECKFNTGLNSLLPKNIQKVSEIIQYLDVHYADSISLSGIAEEMHLSAPYVSKIFKETTGIGFLEYLNRLRVKKTLPSLCTSSQYIIDIALANGFNSLKSYTRSFQTEFKISPTEYRRLHSSASNNDSKKDIQLKRKPSAELMPNLLNFLYEPDSASDDAAHMQNSRSVTIDQNLCNPVFHKTAPCFNQILSVGPASLLLHHKMQQEVLTAVSQIGYEYVHISGILSDLMQIYQEDAENNPHYFYGTVDEVLDFLIHHKIKPYIALGYMPQRLAFSNGPSPYQWNANISKPKSMEQWNLYLKSFLNHCISRYTYEAVLTWKFEFWNSYEYFWHDSLNDFMDFMAASYKTFRQVLPDGILGTPAFTHNSSTSYIHHFLKICQTQKINFNFFTLHLFMTADPNNSLPNIADLNAGTNKESSSIDALPFSTGKTADSGPQIEESSHQFYYDDFINHTIKRFTDILDHHAITMPFIISEWNLSPYAHDYIRDTCFMSTYIIKTINMLPKRISSISFWALTDQTYEHSPYQALFTGELGMKTYNGLVKPSYLAFVLLNRMSPNLIKSGEGYRITTSNESIQILLYNYIFFSEDFLNGNQHNISYRERYQVYDHPSDLTFHLHLSLPAGRYHMEEHSLNRQYGSIYDSWVNMGAPDYIDPTIEKFLFYKGFPDIRISEQVVEKHLVLSRCVPEHGILLIILTKNPD